MTRPEVPPRTAALTAACLPALLLLGSAFAASSMPEPCPESARQHVSDLHDMLAEEKVIATVAETVSKPAEEPADKALADADETPAEQPAPEFTTRLPGVSANDMPRFRRHMFRTDI